MLMLKKRTKTTLTAALIALMILTPAFARKDNRSNSKEDQRSKQSDQVRQNDQQSRQSEQTRQRTQPAKQAGPSPRKNVPTRTVAATQTRSANDNSRGVQRREQRAVPQSRIQNPAKNTTGRITRSAAAARPIQQIPNRIENTRTTVTRTQRQTPAVTTVTRQTRSNSITAQPQRKSIVQTPAPGRAETERTTVKRTSSHTPTVTTVTRNTRTDKPAAAAQRQVKVERTVVEKPPKTITSSGRNTQITRTVKPANRSVEVSTKKEKISLFGIKLSEKETTVTNTGRISRSDSRGFTSGLSGIGSHRPRAYKDTSLTRIIDSSHRNGSGGRHKTSGGTTIINNIRYENKIIGRNPHSIYSRIVWPSYRYRVHYYNGPSVICRYIRPKYHRKYIFVSYNGCWPGYYRYARYYYYGWHPYRWYGCYPTAYQVSGPDYNYYTYNTNYYSNDSGYGATPIDHTTFEDVRRKLAEQAAENPDPETLADQLFEQGVTAFEQGDYTAAAQSFADAIALEPNDLIMPFAYTQALFACEQYFKAAEILRLGLIKMPADEQGLYFPRGLYSQDDILINQVDVLDKKAKLFYYDPDMPLLLGYQYIGIEKYEQAREWLNKAQKYEINQSTVAILTKLLNYIEFGPDETL